MILSFINIRKVPREMLKTEGFALGFQHLPRNLANVHEWKIMFDLYIEKSYISVYIPILVGFRGRLMSNRSVVPLWPRGFKPNSDFLLEGQAHGQASFSRGSD